MLLLFGTVAAGCTSFEPARDNAAILKELAANYAASDQRFRPKKRMPYSIAVAPVRNEVTTGGGVPPAGKGKAGEEGKTGEEGKEGQGSKEGEETEGGKEGGGGAEDAPKEEKEENAFTPFVDPALSGDVLVLRYRRPLRRQLLFSPIDPELLKNAPKLQRKIRTVQGGEAGVVYICPRCQNDVDWDQEQCQTCGLRLAPEPVEVCPRCQDSVSPAHDRCSTCGLPFPRDVEPPTEEPGEGEGPVSEPGDERFICYLCGDELDDQNASSCPNCHVALVRPLRDLDGRYVGEITQPEFDPSGRRAWFPANSDLIQEEIAQLLKDYNIFSDVHAMTERKMDEETLVDLASAQNYNFVLVPTLKRYEVAYEGINGWWYPSMALWVGAWLPSLWLPGENYSFDMELEIKLIHARSGRELKTWNRRFPAKPRAKVDQIDRGWYPWSVVLVPAVNLVRQSGYKAIYEGLMPLAKETIKEEILRRVHANFVEKPPPPMPSKSRRSLAMLVGSDTAKEMPPGASVLAYTSNDMDAMDKLLTEVSGWARPPAKLAKRKKNLDWGEVKRFEAASPAEFKPSLENLRNFLSVDVRKLQREDTFLFYFTGFGVTELSQDANLWGDGYERYLVLGETDYNDLAGTALSISELKRHVDQAPCRNVLVILDTSFTVIPDDLPEGDHKTFPKQEDIGQDLGDKFLTDLTMRGGGGRCAVLAAAGSGFYAVESQFTEPPDLSVLTSCFVKGVRGAADYDKDGQVLVQEAYMYAVEECQRWGSFNIGEPLEPQQLGQLTSIGVALKPKVKITGEGAGKPK
ncbi:zinc ribbon domain-containing protein [Planctomycetota bacterium]